MIEGAHYVDTVSVDASVAYRAAASIELLEVGLVDRAALADVLDDYETWEALAGAIDEVLVDAAGVDADALLHDGVVLVSLFAFAAVSVDGYVSG